MEDKTRDLEWEYQVDCDARDNPNSKRCGHSPRWGSSLGLPGRLNVVELPRKHLALIIIILLKFGLVRRSLTTTIILAREHSSQKFELSWIHIWSPIIFEHILAKTLYNISNIGLD